MMRQRRIKRDLNQRSFYLVTSRITGGSFVFGDQEKEKLRGLLFDGQERFGYRVWDYCLMSNHLHCLLEMPAANTMSRQALLDRWLVCQEGKNPGDPGDGVLEAFRLKIHDLSFGVGNVLQRFTQWFNKKNGRWGRLFGDRFDSVLVEADGAVARMMAYITLNPVRAGMVADPAEYRWCGYAERAAGKALRSDESDMAQVLWPALGLPPKAIEGPANEVMPRIWARFRETLLGRAVHRDQHDVQTLADVLNQGNRPLELDWPARLRLKARFATKGMVLGSRAFVENVMAERGVQSRYQREREPEEARAWDEFYCLAKHRRWIE